MPNPASLSFPAKPRAKKSSGSRATRRIWQKSSKHFQAERSAFRLLGTLDGLEDKRAGFAGIAPAEDLHPLAGLQILVVLEEVLDLLQRDLRKVRIILHLLIAQRQLRRRHGDDLLVLARIVFHLQDADRAHVDDAARNQRAGAGDQDVDRVAVFGQRVRHEAVIARIGHRRIEETIDDQGAGVLVHFILDGMTADRNLDNNVDVFRGILTD
ncbi:hypothetical protein RHECNPAF_750022 [Rhizobium etli CNPAF512]|nr:hypothetical protein RHECNPAF_750022 [Rhizobium etli CNPAF512]